MQCKAKSKRSGERCKAPAMHGMQVCYIHGGKSLRGTEHPSYKHGLYAKYLPEGIKAKTADFLDADPFDLTSELALLRALLAELLSYYQDTNVDREGRAVMASLVDEIGRLVERITKLKNQTALTGAEMTYLAVRSTEVINRYIDDPDKRAAFIQELFGEFVPRDRLPATTD